ncbi:MAG: monovalent cation/H+ antiporter complex subunit F [Sulfuricurvum sp.]|jgi:multisubunit Na+/H+ antiporter MnhF subunit|nr:monovalent cation/H+ antiporter complex subunit F [Sulfuricurvum sp.]MDP3023816.1 monovalent cation/H+ antiporter complex subunit F [Sulfuricurvum sp.]MDP3120500.1 monovalent cation/H+ antiporter complex subunit F [Sulfuricurvum sp.]
MTLHLFLASILAFNLIIAAIFILQKRSQSAKMLVSLLLSTTGVGLLLLLYGISQEGALLDVALMFVLLGSVTAILFAKRLRYKRDTRDNGGPDA